ncbi:MAG: hypothetical protein QW625_01935 [Candidatus Nanoarchaeia archaeon]
MEEQKKQTIEIKYEITLGRLFGIFLLALAITGVAAFFIGEKLASKNIKVETPEYCSASMTNEKIIVKCNDLGNLSLDTVCKWLSPELRDKIKIVVVS